MSIKAINWATSMRGISMPQKLCLLILADCHNAERGQCNPKIEHIADVACGSVRAIKSALAALDEAGLISRSRGFATGYSYTLHLEKSAPDARAPDAPNDISADPARATDAPIKVRQMHTIRATDALNHYIEPEVEPEVEPECSKPDKKRYHSSDDERENEYASFDAFWDKWPKKVDKDQARKRWNKLKPDQDLFNKIMANIEAHALAGDWDDRQFIPGPAKYLLNRKWEDQVYARTPSATKKSPTAGNQALAEKMLGELSTGASQI